jgi:hypothetical protein
MRGMKLTDRGGVRGRQIEEEEEVQNILSVFYKD